LRREFSVAEKSGLKVREIKKDEIDKEILDEISKIG